MSNVVSIKPPVGPTLAVRTKMSEGGKKFRSKFDLNDLDKIREAPMYSKRQLQKQIEDRAEDKPFSDMELASFYMSAIKTKVDTAQINLFTDMISGKWKAAHPRRLLNGVINFAEYEWAATGVAGRKMNGQANIKGVYGFTDLTAYAHKKFQDLDREVVFRHGRELVRLARNNKAEREELEILHPKSLRPIVNRVAPFFEGQDDPHSISAPMDVVEELFHGNYVFPDILQLASYPVFDAEGELVVKRGYDEDSCIYLTLPSSTYIPEIPQAPDAKDVARARHILLDHYGDFPFDGVDCRPGGDVLTASAVPASMANFYAMLLTPFSRQMIDGPLPMAFISKPKVATGASLLAETAYLIATGTSEPSAALPPNEDEIGKVLFASFCKPKPYLWFDNVSGEIKSDKLAAVLTATTFEGRTLGKSTMATVSVNAMTVMTSNNALLNADLKRRSFLIRLDAKMENPKERSGFKYDLEGGYVKKNRNELLWACLTLIRAWVEAGMPNPTHAPKMASYGEWVRVLGGILEHAGITSFLANEAEKDSVASINEDQGINDLVSVWWEQANAPKGERTPLEESAMPTVERAMVVGGDNGLVELCLAEDIDLEGVRKTRRDGDVIYDARSLGKYLARHADQYFKIDGVEVRLARGKSLHRKAVWELVPKET